MRPRLWRDAGVGVVYLLIVVLLVGLSVAVYTRKFSTDVKVSVLAGDAGSALQAGSDVQVRGISVGQVVGVTTSGDGARIQISVNRDRAKQIPADTTARLLPKTLFGERYVSLVVPTLAARSGLHDGDTIRQDTSAEGVELQKIFDKLLPLLQAVQPEKLASVLGEIAQALRGRGELLGSTVTGLNGYAAELAPKVPALADDLAALANVANTYSTAAPDIIHSLDDLTVTSKTLVAQRAQLTSLFATVTTAGNTLSGFLETNERNIITLSKDSLPTLQVLARFSGEFPCVTAALRDFIPVADKAFGADTGNPGLRVTLNVVPSMGKYIAGADTPTGGVPSGGPSCPYAPPVGVASTAVGSVLQTGPSAATPGATAQSSALSPSLASYLASAGNSGNGVGTANSPQENEIIAELVGPTVGVAPSKFPAWGSLLLGPLLRGTEVTVR